MSRARAALGELLVAPFRELLAGLDSLLAGGRRVLLRIFAGLLAGWWIYVPVHELLHALGCWAAGGTVTRLEIDPVYGGRWLARILPFVSPGGAYAGRLAGFETHGSDWVYLATDLAPFVLCLLPGFWWLRRAARRGQSIPFGAALPFALAPLLSLTGDAYEIGSLLTVHLPAWRGMRELIGDDLPAKAAAVLAGGDPRLVTGLISAALAGLLWALGSILAARALATAMGEPRLPYPPPLGPSPDRITLG